MLLKVSTHLPDNAVSQPKHGSVNINTLWTGHADLRLYITTVQDG